MFAVVEDNGYDKAKITPSQAGKLGGLKRWSTVPKEQRSIIMREIAFKRWKFSPLLYPVFRKHESKRKPLP